MTLNERILDATEDPAFLARFWDKVERVGAGDCWRWTASASPQGYGRIGLLWESGRCALALAHRVSWTVAFGIVPEEMCVLHRCDNPPCCNPGHLFLGDRADNYADCRSKGRDSPPPYSRGEQKGNSKLTRAEVLAIRWLKTTTFMSQRRISLAFDVSQGLVNKILHRKLWAHVT